MRNIIIIGTLHEGLTPESELFEELEKNNPSQVLVEITDEDVKSENFSSYPPEMQSTYSWAKKHKVKIRGFDSKIDILKSSVTKEKEAAAVERFKKKISGLTWKDLNKEWQNKDEDIDEIIDKKKDLQREQEMLSNIRKLIAKNGTILIITGCGHLNFFEKNLSSAKFPLR